jgi:hypothetical protein
MSRRVYIPGLLPQPDPEPTYPEYEELRQEARRKDGGPIGGQTIACMEDVVNRRGGDWCTAVLGRPFPGIRHVPSADGWMLILADERGIEPELPARIVEVRRVEEARRKERGAQAAAKLEAEMRRWDLITASAPVTFSVQENTRHTGVRGPLKHITAPVYLRSGRSRLHSPGRALCETPDRTNRLVLGGPLVDLPPTCTRCIEYAGLVRTLEAPAPPTRTEFVTLQLIRSGTVFTMRPGRGRLTVRDTSERSDSAAWGQLGRKVDAAVRRVERKGWALAVEDELSRTLLGHLGHRWRLTEAGTAALEG